MKYKPVGFDLKDTPMGKDIYLEKLGCQYQDVFTGIIFYQPLQKQILDNNIPGFYSKEFKTTVGLRSLLIGQHYWENIQNMWDDRELHPEKYGKRYLFDETGFDHVKNQIMKWLS